MFVYANARIQSCYSQTLQPSKDLEAKKNNTALKRDAINEKNRDGQNILRCSVELTKYWRGIFGEKVGKTVERRANLTWTRWTDVQVSWKSFSSVRLFCSAMCI